MRSRGHLPHLVKEGSTYFVTFRLADAVAQRADTRSSPDSPEELAATSDPPLTLGSCLLRDQEASAVVVGALAHFRGTRYELLAWCVMPNHVHVVVQPWQPWQLAKTMHTWKSFSANKINSLVGRRGRLWEREYFDHLIRREEYVQRFADYVEGNPVAAGLCALPQEWPFSSAFPG